MSRRGAQSSALWSPRRQLKGSADVSTRAWGLAVSVAAHAALAILLLMPLGRDPAPNRPPIEVRILRPSRAWTSSGDTGGGGGIGWPGRGEKAATGHAKGRPPRPPVAIATIPARTPRVPDRPPDAVASTTAEALAARPEQAEELNGEAAGAGTGTAPDGDGPGHGGWGGGAGGGMGGGVGGGAGPGRGAGAGQGFDFDLTPIRERIARLLVYPPAARQRGWQGKVVVSFVLLRDGGVRNVRVVTSSGFGSLDRSAVAAVQAAAPFPAPGEDVEITTPVLFRLD